MNLAGPGQASSQADHRWRGSRRRIRAQGTNGARARTSRSRPACASTCRPSRATASNPNADALTFRNEDGSPARYSSGSLPGTNLLWSPRVGFNWDVNSDQKTQIRGGTGVFTGQPLHVWISNQLGNTGVLQGSARREHEPASVLDEHRCLQAHERDAGAGAASYELDDGIGLPVPAGVAHQHRRGSPSALGLYGHGRVPLQPRHQRHLLHHSNLPAAQSTFTGPDTGDAGWARPAAPARPASA